VNEIWESVSRFITTENVALFSIIITVLIFVLSRRAELRYKKHDDKKTQYLKLISLLEKMHLEMKRQDESIPKKSNLSKHSRDSSKISEDIKKLYFDTGASLFLYGSKKLYRQYLLFREFSLNPLIMQCKYYREDVGIYILANMLMTIRKEVGLSLFNSLQANEALGFFVNDITNNHIANAKAIDAKFRIRMIRLELAVINQYKFVTAKRIFSFLVKPIFGGLLIILKYLVVLPFGRLLAKIFPSWAAGVSRNEAEE